MTRLELVDIQKGYECELFLGVNFSLDSAQSLAILGVSGSGKSTLLHISSTLLSPDSGSVLFNGIDIYAQSPDKRLEILRYEIGIIFQSHYLFRGFSGRDNLEVASLLSGKDIDTDLLLRLGIADILGQDISSISGGQAQRLSIARTLTKRPSLIIADEPTGNLDSASARVVIEILLEYVEQNGAILLIATHDESIAELCSRTMRLEDRHLVSI